MKSKNEKIILTALDNNHKLWYENFIPFVLSLRATGYDGDIGVIDYGLSEEKKQRLTEQNIRLYSAANQYNELIVDRHYSLAEIAKQSEYNYLAIYDADIWFPHSQLTVFEQIKNKSDLYCAYDLWYCTFLENCVQKYGIDRVRQELATLVNRNGFVWQAGVIVGHKEAWIDYQKYMVEILSNEGDFSISYGIDTTILNLYSVHKDRISYLDKKYNCPPTWGIRQLANETFIIDGEIVEGIHLTRAYRDNPQLNYTKLHAEYYYEEGKKFVEKGQKIYSIIKASLTEPFKAEFKGDEITLKVLNVTTNGRMVIGIDASKHIFPEISQSLDVSGYCEISLINPHLSPITLIYARTSVFNMDESENVSVILGSEENVLRSDKNHSFMIELKPQEEITFMTKDLDINKATRWIFRNIRFVD